MGPQDAEKLAENKANRQFEKEKDNVDKAAKRFEELKNQKLAEKFGKDAQMSNQAMLEWIDLNKQLQFDRTGKPFDDKITASQKTRSVFLENPLVPIGKYNNTLKYKVEKEREKRWRGFNFNCDSN